jgi:hypothetical protein
MTNSVSSFADLEQLPWENRSDIDEPTGRLATDFVLSGDHMTLSMRADIGGNQFLVTSMLRGIASNLQFSRVSAEDKLDDMQTKAQASMEGAVPEGDSRAHQPLGELDHPERIGLTDAQQIFAESLLEQLSFIEDLFVDLRTFWKEVNDNPEFKLLNRSDIEVRQGMREAAKRKAAKLASERRTGAVFAIGDIATRRAAIPARRK